MFEHLTPRAQEAARRLAASATELDQCPDAGLEGFTGRAIRNTVASARELLSALGETP